MVRNRADFCGLSADASPVRELSADFYRVIAVVVVVIGHWLVSAVTFHDGRFGNDYPLVVLPWTQWLTWIFQVVPVFFLVGGYASAASFARVDDGGRQRLSWVQQRLSAILGPTTMYVMLALVAIAGLEHFRLSRSSLSFGGWAIAMHLWFVPVYLVVVALTPVAVAADRRWGLRVPAFLVLAVVAVDVAGTAYVSRAGWANYILCWAAVYQIGICWRRGELRSPRPLLFATAAAVVLGVLLALGYYPISMVGVPGAPVQNSTPPTVALLVFAVMQAGLLIAVAPLTTRWLQRSRWRRPLAAANRNVMALYLWQMVPVVVVALAGYPTGLLPQPLPGTGAWWLFRLVWLAVLAMVTAAELTFLWLTRSAFNRPLPTVTTPLPARCIWLLLALGVGLATLALSRFAAAGFAPDGRFPTVYALLYAVAIGLISLSPPRSGSYREITAAKMPKGQPRDPAE